MPPLVLMTDDARAADWVEAVRALPSGSAVVVRHRDARKREALARQLRSLCAQRRVLLLIADDAALAVRVRADGVHLPQARMARVAGVRGTNARWLVTTSAHDAAAVVRALRSGADAIFAAPVFATASHRARAALGVVRFAVLATRAPGKVLALGGADARSAPRLTGLPIAGVALIGGWIRS